MLQPVKILVGRTMYNVQNQMTFRCVFALWAACVAQDLPARYASGVFQLLAFIPHYVPVIDVSLPESPKECHTPKPSRTSSGWFLGPALSTRFWHGATHLILKVRPALPPRRHVHGH